MKKLVTIASVLTLLGAGLQTVDAGQREWATAGKILTGVAIGAAVATALEATPVRASVSVSYGAPPPCAGAVAVVAAPPPVASCPPPVVVCRVPPPPVVVYERPACPPRPLVVVKPARPRPHHHWCFYR